MVDNLEPDHSPPPPSVDEPLIPLPGVDPDAPAGASALELAARRTIAALHAAGVLGESHALQCQLLLDLASGYTASVRATGGKVTVAASAVAAQIQNLLEALPKAEGGDGDEADAWRQLVADLRATGGESALRNPAGPE